MTHPNSKGFAAQIFIVSKPKFSGFFVQNLPREQIFVTGHGELSDWEI